MWDLILSAYPEIEGQEADLFNSRTIVLQDDSDGLGVYISEWTYSKPIPKGLKLGK